jgi:hypothetical protein
MGLLLKLHGEVRWLVALVGVLVIVKFGVGWARRAEFKGMDRGLMAAFTGLLDLNIVLGAFVLFATVSGSAARRYEHIATMLLAIVVAHTSVIWRRSDDAVTKFRNNMIVVALALLLVAVGVTRLRGGWIF